MAIQTLSEVKKENEQLEKEEDLHDDQVNNESPDVEQELKKLLEDDDKRSDTGNDNEKEPQEQGEQEEQEAEEGQEVESWLVDDDEADGKAVPLSDHIEVRQKLKEKNRDLQAELDEIKAGLQQQQQQYQQQQQQPAFQNQY